MTLLLENAIFFAYAGMAFLVGVVSILWGSQWKIMGAGLLLASIIISNILFRLFQIGDFSVWRLSFSYALIDLALAYLFVLLYRRSNRLERNRWAGALAFIQIGMASANILGVARPQFASSGRYGLVLNSLMILALGVCLIAFTPKSRNEAIGVLKIKWLYFISDLFRRVIAPLRQRSRKEVKDKRQKATSKWVNAQIGARIREARITRELSQEELGAAVGISPSQIQKFESGANRVSASMLFELAKFLGVEVSFFYAEIEVGAPFGVVKN